MPTTREYPSGKDALILSLPAREAKTKDVVAKALGLMGWTKNDEGAWQHPTLEGKTPDATLAAALYTTLVKSEVVLKPSKGMVQRGPKFNEALKEAKARQTAREEQHS